jgi:uncharacterized protein involved in exopolysaccharide biosynthesis
MAANQSPGAIETPGEFSLRSVLTVVFKHRALILAFSILVPVAVVSSVLSRPPTYEASATLLVNKARAEVPLAPTESPQLIVNQLSESDLNSEIEILKGRRLIAEALRSLDLEPGNPRPEGFMASLRSFGRRISGTPELSRFDSMALHLQQSIEVHAIRKSNVIRVSYRSEDPEWAAQVVGAVTERYLEHRANMNQSPQALGFFDDQMEAAAARLSDAEADLQEYLESAGVTLVEGPRDSDPLAAQKALVLERLARLQNDLGDVEVEIDGKLNEVQSLQERLAQEPDRLPSSNRLNQDPAIDEMERALAALELERDALLQEFKPDSRHVRDINTQIEMAEARLARAEADRNTIGGTELNPTHRELKSELLRAEADLEGARARYASLQQQVSDFSRELDHVNQKAYRIGQLLRTTTAAEADYLLYRKKHEEARISAAMDQHRLINVSIAQPAERPIEPVSRNLKMRGLAALFLGVSGGFGLAFVRERYISHTMTNGEDVERLLGIPHIASIPHEKELE